MEEKLVELATQLGTTVEYLWPLMVQKIVIDWWADLAVTCFVGVLSALALWVTVKASKTKSSWFWDGTLDMPELGGVFAAIGVVIGCLWFVVSIGVQLSTISTLFYPEISALEKIAGSI